MKIRHAALGFLLLAAVALADDAPKWRSFDDALPPGVPESEGCSRERRRAQGAERAPQRPLGPGLRPREAALPVRAGGEEALRRAHGSRSRPPRGAEEGPRGEGLEVALAGPLL